METPEMMFYEVWELHNIGKSEARVSKLKKEVKASEETSN